MSPATHDGYVIGDAILFYLDENQLQPRRPSAGGQLGAVQPRDRRLQRDGRARRAIARSIKGRRKLFRYQVQGPNAAKVMEKVTGKAAARHPVLQHGRFTIAGCEVRALRHGMVGQPGWELFGPWEQGDAVRDAIVEAGKEFGIRQVGARTYPDQLPRVGMDSLAAAGGLHGREMKAVPRSG